MAEPKAKRQPEDRAKHLVKHQWKPGQSGNPRGRVPGTRNKLAEDFFRDLCESWEALGKPALLAAAWLSPIDYVKVVASLMPKETHATVTKVNLDRMSSDELRAILNEERGSEDPAGSPAHPEILQ